MPVRMPSDREIEGMRVRGELECRCREPIPTYLDMWNAYQCDRCFKVWYPR